MVILLIVVAVAAPIVGVTRVQELAKTFAPVPVSSVNNAARFALVGVVKKVAAPVANPLTPVVIGSPVQLVNVPADGVPIFGVTNVGEVDITKVVPVPVCEAMLVALPIDVIGPVKFALVVAV